MIKTTTIAPQAYSGIEYELPSGIRYKLQVVNSVDNCKMAAVPHIQGMLANLKDDEDRKTVIEAIKKFTPQHNILVTLTNKEYADWFTKNFTCYYCVPVPVGYNKTNQYHVLIKNDNETREPIKEEPVKLKLPSKKILDIISGAFEATASRKGRLKLIEEKLEQTEF